MAPQSNRIDLAQTPQQAARFLLQATPGATHGDIHALTGQPYAAWLDAQMARPVAASHFDWLLASGYGAEEFRNSFAGLDATLWRALIGGTDGLRQRVALALSEIFVVSALGISGAPWRAFCVANYVDLLTTHAFGNYRTLIEAITRSTAMGIYLTYRGSSRADPATGSQPDENYARELLQLFSIGLVELEMDGTPVQVDGAPVETYDQADIAGLARVFTGWDLDRSGLTTPLPADVHRRPMSNVRRRYETGEKRFLGTVIPAGVDADTALDIALDAIFHHPNVPPFIGRQLIQRLVTSNPSPAYVARVAAAFANNGKGVRGDLAATLRAVLLDAEARDLTAAADPSFGKLREPVLRFLGWARAFGATSISGKWRLGDLSDPATRLGQSPLRATSVFNFFRPGYVPPGTAIADAGLVAPEFQIATETSVSGYINFMQGAIANLATSDIRADYASLVPLAAQPRALLDEINLVLAGGQVDAATLDEFAAALATMPTATPLGTSARIGAAVLLVLAAPAYLIQK